MLNFVGIGMRKVLFFLIVMVGLATQVAGQSFFYSTRNYSVSDGLPQSQVTSLVEDNNGYLWAGTQGGGLTRFDGRKFKVYTTKDGLLSNDITGLLLDQHQNLWILHVRGVTRFNGREFKQFADPRSMTQPKRFRRVYERGDSIFLITSNGGQAKIHNDSVHYWENFHPEHKRIVRFQRVTKAINLFFYDDMSFRVENSNGNSYSFRSALDFGKVYYSFLKNDEVFFRTMKGLFKLNYRDKLVEPVSWGLQHYVLAYDSTRDFFWTSSETHLLKEYQKDGVWKTDTVLHDIQISQIINDSEGNTWFASNGHGLYKYFIQDFNRCSSDKLKGVMSFLKDKNGRQWIGTFTKGIWSIYKGEVKSYTDKDEGNRNSIRAIKQGKDGTIWVATGGGLGRYNQATDSFVWYGREDGLPTYSIMSLDFDERNNLWIGTTNGISFFNGKSFRNFYVEDGLLSNMIWYIHYSKVNKTLYIGHDFGMQTLKDGKIGILSVPGLTNSNIISIHPFRDSLIAVGTGGAGVLIYNPLNGTHKYITTNDGLASDFIYFAAADEKHDLWIGSEKGINRVRLNDSLDLKENLYYGYDNGLTGIETNANAFLITPEEKYFGLIDGLYEFNNVNKQYGKSFDVHLTGIELLYGEYDAAEYSKFNDGFFKLPLNPQLPSDKNHVTFYFNRVDKRYPKSVKFKYYLENFDKKWSMPSSTSEVTYGNLPPGDYIFRVVSTDNNGSWSSREVVYPFTIVAPFYQQASFIITALLLLAGFIALVLYLRVKQRINQMLLLERIRVKEQESLRKEIARDFHDEMGNQLTRIINYVSLLRLNQYEYDEKLQNGTNMHVNGRGGSSNDLYDKVENSAKYLYSGTRDFIWSIDPVNDELSKLFIYIRDFGEKLFEEKNIKFRAFNNIKEKVRLPYGFSREANLIFKEAMTNAFKYSQANNVMFSLNRAENGEYLIELKDDGIGFSTDEMKKSNGLQNIQERAIRINAILRITSSATTGTSIQLVFKNTKTLIYGLTL